MKVDSISTPFILLIIAPLAWFGAQVFLSFLIRPYRRKLKDGLEFLNVHGNLNTHEKEQVHLLWQNSFAPRTAIILSLTYLTALIMRREAIIRLFNDEIGRCPNIWADKRFDDIMDWYFISVFVANPLFGVLAIFLRVCWILKVKTIYRNHHGNRFKAIPPFDAAARV